MIIRSRKTRDPKKSVVFPPSGACFCSSCGVGRPILSESYLPTYLLEGLKTGSVPRETRCLKEGSGGGVGWCGGLSDPFEFELVVAIKSTLGNKVS